MSKTSVNETMSRADVNDAHDTAISLVRAGDVSGAMRLARAIGVCQDAGLIVSHPQTANNNDV